MSPVFLLPLTLQIVRPNFDDTLVNQDTRKITLNSEKVSHFYFDVTETDKLLHFTVSMVEVVGVTFVTRKVFKWNKPLSILSGILVTTLSGLAKEYVFDKVPDHHDLVADGVGITAGATISFAVF